MAKREQWGSKFGFLCAAVGSAVGLGNMWRFSYMAAENGGAAFVLLYVIMTVLIGLPLLLAELTVGRAASASPIQALEILGDRRYRKLGWFFLVGALTISAYYGVISGWTARYAVESWFSGFREEPEAHFVRVASGRDALGWHVGFLLTTTAVVAGGIKGGIERFSTIFMPLLFALVIGLAMYAATLEGATQGYRYFLQADFEKILSLRVLGDAAGHAFFSLSLAMGAMLTFASYLDTSHNLVRESVLIAGADFLVAFFAGLVVFPMIFALGLQDSVQESTLGALFITLPKAFHTLGLAGKATGFVFFTALFLGALTSAISLLEVVVSSAMDGFGWSRLRATLVSGSAAILLGVPAALNIDVLDWMDRLVGNVLLIVNALVLTIFVGWVMKNPIAEARRGSTLAHGWGLWYLMLRFIAPALLTLLLIHSVIRSW